MRLFYNFQSKNISSVLLIILVLTNPALQTGVPTWNGWQGTGNMTGSNMTEIQATIANYPITSTTSLLSIDGVAQTISIHLNDLWAPAWNVVIIKCPSGYDSVVYGYSFRYHWMWINGVSIPGATTVLAYIIWKDFNCHTWSLFSAILQSQNTFPSDVSLLGYTFTRINTDVWAEAFDFVNYLNDQSADSKAFTVILSQHPTANIRGYVCLVNKNYSFENTVQSGSVAYGTYIVLQTRWDNDLHKFNPFIHSLSATETKDLLRWIKYRIYTLNCNPAQPNAL